MIKKTLTDYVNKMKYLREDEIEREINNSVSKAKIKNDKKQSKPTLNNNYKFCEIE